MAIFKTLKYKNIQSVGNHPIEIQLDKSPTTLIGGENGSGKSTMLYAFAYCLFGKFLSGLKLAEAINSVNKKALYTEVSFESNGKDYLVIRGEKPKKFEIWVDGEEMDKSANARDQQKILEIILGMDFKLFTQIILLNKERYEPFMDLSAGDRRKVVEDVLDINIFSEMNDIVKERIKENKREQTNLERDRTIQQTEIDGQRRLINQIEDSIARSNEDVKQQLEDYRQERKSIKESVEELNSEIESINFNQSELDKVSKNRKGYEELGRDFDNQIKTSMKNKKFFTDNDYCGTCGQDIDENLKQAKVEEYDKEASRIRKVVNEMIEELTATVETETELKNKQIEVNRLRQDIRDLEFSDKKLEESIEKLLNRSASSSEEENLKEATLAYDNQEKALQELTESLSKSIKQGEILEQFRNGLKDEGIKSMIVKEYIDLMNKKINEYLYSMNFYINMKLDENFKESFHAMHKESFTISNLSTGQKSRVNLAIWLALLEVASIKNSVVSNVLFLDEILENLDENGVKDFVALCNDKLSDKHIFCITQRYTEFFDMFRSSMRFKLNGGFTEIEQ